MCGRPWRTLTGRSRTRRRDGSARTPSTFDDSDPAESCKARRDSGLRGIHGSHPSGLGLLSPSRPRDAHRAGATPASRGDEPGKDARWAMRFGNLPLQYVPLNPCPSLQRSSTLDPALQQSKKAQKKTQMRGAPVLPAPPNSSEIKSTLQVRAPPRNRQVATPPGYRGNITSP
jgi:hypothetical protein